jgi:hypothetical protein
MFYVQALPFLLGVLVVFLIGLLGWDLMRYSKHKVSNMSIGSRDDILIGLLVLAAFTSGVFVAVILLTIVQ